MNKWVKKWLTVYLKCYINLILFHRNVYPSASFDMTTYQAFNLPQFVPINRHPGLQAYIEELVEDILSKLLHVYLVCICIVSKENDTCIEKYVLDFGEFQHVDDVGVLTETEVFDEFRSSLNSLISTLERMQVRIRNDTVTFQPVINTMEMELGHSGYQKLDTEMERLTFERDTNWVKIQEDSGLPSKDEKSQPKIKMSSLLGCDVGPLVIHNYMETLIVNNDSLDDIYQKDGKYDAYYEDTSISG